MHDIEITMDAGTKRRLLTAGKYCDKNILVTAEKQSGGTDIPTPPEDGKTRLYIRIPQEGYYGYEKGVTAGAQRLRFSQTAANGVSIDWGDGSEAESSVQTGAVVLEHCYENPGEYVITMDPADGCTMDLGDGTNNLLAEPGDAGYDGYIYGERNITLYRATLGKGISSLGDCAFQECYALEEVVIPGSVSRIGTRAFCLCRALRKLELREGVTEIGDESFQECRFRQLYLPESLQTIGNSAFMGCDAMQQIYIPRVSRIEDEAFYSCFSLTSVNLPRSMTYIGSNAFSECGSLRVVYVNAWTPPEGDSMFDDYHEPGFLKIYVPYSALKSYRDSFLWGQYSDFIAGF